jgi:hypothetical protein
MSVYKSIFPYTVIFLQQTIPFAQDVIWPPPLTGTTRYQWRFDGFDEGPLGALSGLSVPGLKRPFTINRLIIRSAPRKPEKL